LDGQAKELLIKIVKEKELNDEIVKTLNEVIAEFKSMHEDLLEGKQE
jgi:hypothetical protein